MAIPLDPAPVSATPSRPSASPSGLAEELGLLPCDTAGGAESGRSKPFGDPGGWSLAECLRIAAGLWLGQLGNLILLAVGSAALAALWGPLGLLLLPVVFIVVMGTTADLLAGETQVTLGAVWGRYRERVGPLVRTWLLLALLLAGAVIGLAFTAGLMAVVFRPIGSRIVLGLSLLAGLGLGMLFGFWTIFCTPETILGSQGVTGSIRTASSITLRSPGAALLAILMNTAMTCSLLVGAVGVGLLIRAMGSPAFGSLGLTPCLVSGLVRVAKFSAAVAGRVLANFTTVAVTVIYVREKSR